MIAPVGLQLSRAKGFRLQAMSLALNGLPAINVGRPFKDGNQFVIGKEYGKSGGSMLRVANAEHAVALHRAELERSIRTAPQACDLMFARLRGHNLACWCGIGSPCHRDTLLYFSNRIPA